MGILQQRTASSYAKQGRKLSNIVDVASAAESEGARSSTDTPVPHSEKQVMMAAAAEKVVIIQWYYFIV
eukprot:12892386-Prorocentrum_lima.AAC.1